ncbi:transcription factor GTE11-like, partial [Gastrolobium bilobum]|uniref:transcription factor GTE11-like n=1 Tax=Gastrolobium bilobum TaxID=150636 RepID=UPI002AB242D4
KVCLLDPKNLEIKTLCSRVEVDSGLKKYEFIEKASHFDENECSNSKEKSSMTGSIKRGPQGIIEGHKEKRHGWAFNKPVDPVALNIPDYFTVISHPMDLGTIKSKLEKNIYFSIEEFAADVRLTFSNAMTYNPPMNAVHLMATELKKIFERKWKDLEKKCKCENANEKIMTGAVRGHVRKFCNRMPPLQKDTLPKMLQVPEMKEIQKISSLDGRHAKVRIVFFEGKWSTPVYDILLSPKQAIRVATLKHRFADTIRKAQNETLLDQGVKMKMQKERERKQLEAARMKANEALEKEREAERVRIQKIERTVEIQNDLTIWFELEMLCGGKLCYGDFGSKHCSRVAMDKSRAQNPLERLGLFFKDDYITSDEDVEDLCSEI